MLTTPGVHMVVSYAGQLAAIHRAIEAIRRALESSKHVEPHPFLKTGDWVGVHSGSLAGIEGILVRKLKPLRVALVEPVAYLCDS